jgi:hypothetical protein
MSSSDILTSARQHIASRTTSDLVEMLRIANDRAVETLIIEALEVRIDGLTDTLEAWSEDFESELTQAEVVLKAVA